MSRPRPPCAICMIALSAWWTKPSTTVSKPSEPPLTHDLRPTMVPFAAGTSASAGLVARAAWAAGGVSVFVGATGEKRGQLAPLARRPLSGGDAVAHPWALCHRVGAPATD